MKKKTYDIKIRNYNNKSRQGTYIQITNKQNKTEKTLTKYDTQYPIELYIQYHLKKHEQPKGQRRKKTTTKKFLQTYQETITNTEPTKIKPTNKVQTEARKYVQKIKKQYGGKTLERMIKRGIQAVIINDTHKANQHTIKTSYKKLLQDLVLDKKLLEILATEENMKKMSHRIEQRIEIKNEQGQTILETSKIGVTTNQAISEINQTIKKGEEIKKSYQTDTKIQTLKNLGWTNIQQKEQNKMTTNRIQLTTILRKAN